MQDIQEVFVRIQEAKKAQKDIKEMYKDGLANTPGYKEIVEEMKTLREKKKMVETATRESMSSEWTKLEDLKIDIDSDMELMSDIAMTKIMKGETVTVTDQYDNEYEPSFSVKFKKAN